ncbi:SMP-30/Gluconolaconase/LRE-like region-domain-containing protein [Xylariaceae sp. FL0662B]|nr:SMP-30/Gluconolaconase/LRE-like region-domain-containing protein [Xylariaceae sp. FL0662B]
MSNAATRPALQQWHVTEPYLHLRCGLGEGPYYEAATHSLRFVDIKKRRVHVVALNAGADAVQTIQLDTPVTVTADIEGVDPRARIAISAKYGVAVLDRATGRYEYVARFAPDGRGDDERLRSNDGAVDPHGRFWLGTMTDIGLDLEPEGSLFLFDGTTRPAQSMRHPVTIPNSVSWSPDRRTLYFTDSTRRTIFAFDYHGPENGSIISNERVFYVHDGPGEPDGCRVDVDGNLWQAVYGESRVLKISSSGELVGEVRLPTHNITCTQFVGTELFITSAAMEKGEGPDEAVELGGALFRVDVGVRGLEPFLFKLGSQGQTEKKTIE